MTIVLERTAPTICAEMARFLLIAEQRLTYGSPGRRHPRGVAPARVAGAYVQAARLKAPAHGQTMILTPGAARNISPETMRL